MMMTGPIGVGGVYTGNGFDSSQAGAGTATADHVIAIASGSLTNINYVTVNNLHYAACVATAQNGASDVKLRVRRRETGTGTWFDVIAEKGVVYTSSNAIGENETDYDTSTIVVIITLASGEKTNGIDIEFHTNSTTAGDSASFTNLQTWFEGRLGGNGS